MKKYSRPASETQTNRTSVSSALVCLLAIFRFCLEATLAERTTTKENATSTGDRGCLLVVGNMIHQDSFQLLILLSVILYWEVPVLMIAKILHPTTPRILK